MIRHGKKVNKTVRYYTDDDIRKACKREIEGAIHRMSDVMYNVCLMAFKDYVTEHAPKINISSAVRDYEKLVDKYSEDYVSGEFSLTQLKNYNRNHEE